MIIMMMYIFCCTCDILSKKMNVHIAEAKRKLREGNLLHKLMRDIGHERFVIDLIENFPCENIYQLRQRQGFFRRQYGTLHKYLDDHDYRKKMQKDSRGKYCVIVVVKLEKMDYQNTN